jgi:hypothetical protein
MTLILTIAVAWIAFIVIFCIIWSWACKPTLDERMKERSG